MKRVNILAAAAVCCAVLFSTGCNKNTGGDPEIIFYEEGDLYSVGLEKAVVYKVVTISGGMYALAVSMDEAELSWSSEYVKTGADELENGLENQKTIQALTDWETKYPAFKWCADKNKNGTGCWYLPSAAEMRELYNTSFPDPETGESVWLGDYIEYLGGTPFGEPDELSIPPYWTSTEGPAEDAAATLLYFKSNGISWAKDTSHKVRAVKYIRIY